SCEEGFRARSAPRRAEGRRSWMTPRRPGRAFFVVGLDQFEERSAERLRMEEGNLVAARSQARDLVDERHALLVEAAQESVDVADAEREMVEGVAALLQEPGEARVAAQGLLGRHQFQ